LKIWVAEFMDHQRSNKNIFSEVPSYCIGHNGNIPIIIKI
jgi:hypothetical protein